MYYDNDDYWVKHRQLLRTLQRRKGKGRTSAHEFAGIEPGTISERLKGRLNHALPTCDLCGCDHKTGLGNCRKISFSADTQDPYFI